MFDPVVSQLYQNPTEFGVPEEVESSWTAHEVRSIDTLFIPGGTTSTKGVPNVPLEDLRLRLGRLRSPPVISHASAALLLGLPLPLRIASDQRLHLTVPRSQARPTQKGLHSHLGDLVGGETFTMNGIPITSPPRIVADLAGVLTLPELNILLDGAADWLTYFEPDNGATVTTLNEFDNIMMRRNRFPGREQLHKLLDLKNQKLIPSHIGPVVLGPKNWQSYLAALIANRYSTQVKVLSPDQLVIPAHNVIVVQPWHLEDDRNTAMNIAASITALRSFGWCAFSLSYRDLLSEKDSLELYFKARNREEFNHLRCR